MKSFYQFQEDAAGATQKAVSASGSFEGSSSADGDTLDHSQKKLDWIGKKKKKKDEKEKQQKDIKKKPLATKPDGPGKQKDRKPQKYRQATKTATPIPEKGGALAKRPTPSSGSMVQKKKAASQQPPQHKQVAARPVSTAMAGAKKKPAIKAAPEKKAIKPAPERKAISGGPPRPQINPQAARKRLAPAKKALPPADG